MSFVYSCDVLEKLKSAGYSSYRIRQEKLLGQVTLQKIREGKMVSWNELDQICTLLRCQPGDLIRHQAEDSQIPAEE